ncbi:branched-chain amino acid ABC transporter permease [Kaistia sp. 32K]|uniref:branched-chain amino acid ABC transporter permease n=1 Tax=Kaistia sp. 32K TaxID=2795690 RepID=UPI0019165A1B|nr:branched-chain amino acid ABC transporter permease [Kaistia sp. 32K]BCP52222.1 branched-chain amino acid ABC transporter permease [Kaistia sp. 32K]
MNQILQIAFDTISLGALYALAALGVGLVFGVMRLVNFAFGDYITWAGYALLLPAIGFGASLGGAGLAVLSVALPVAVAIGLALLTERIAFHPLRRADSSTLLIASFAVSYLLQNLILMTVGGRPQSVDIGGALAGLVVLGGVRLAILDLVTLGVAAALMAALYFVLSHTLIGIQLRAASENFGMARLLGVRANRIIAAAFALSGLLAAFVSLLLVAKTGSLDYRMGMPLVLAAFIGTVVGGLGNIVGAAVGGFLIGAVAMICQHVLPADLRGGRDAFVFAFVVLVLLVRPRGLLTSTKSLERV